MNINKYKRFVESGVYQDSAVEKLADRYSQQEQVSISHLDILFHSSRANIIYKNDTGYKCIVDYGGLPKKSSVSNNQLVYYREVWTQHSDSIQAGDIVQFAHNLYEERETYLFLKSIETRNGYDLSIMQKCNSELKWIDENGAIKTFPCLFYSNSRSNFGNRDDKAMTLPDGRRQAIVQKNEHTCKIIRDRRFMFGESVFKVIDFDTVSDDGIVNLNMKDDLFNPTVDNRELGIADYYGNIAVKNLIIKNAENTVSVGSTLMLDAVVTNNGKVEDAKLTFKSSDNQIANVDNNGMTKFLKVGNVTLTAEWENLLAEINLNVIESTINNYSVDILGGIDPSEMKFNVTRTYSCVFKNNGNIIPDSSTFSITADDGLSPTSLASIINQESTANTCLIKAGNVKGFIRLNVKNNSGIISKSIRIEIKPLF